MASFKKNADALQRVLAKRERLQAEDITQGFKQE
jgi:hypothetical protein